MEPNFLNGTVELMLLAVIDEGPSYGYEITQSVLNRSGGRFEVKEGSLYPALHRLERAKLLESYWTEHDGRRRKYYRLTPSGRKALAARRTEWQSFSAGLHSVLGLELQAVGATPCCPRVS
ncbi:MAG: PadR family transcriptional regulator [Pirellulales bacterium]